MSDSNGNGSERSTTGHINRRNFLRTTGGAAVIGTLAGCSGGSGDGGGDADGGNGDGGGGGSTGGGDEGPITIGALQPLSGTFAAWGKVHSDGLSFAVEEINANGGVLGRELEVTESDTESKPGEADRIFRQMVEQEDAVATTGPVSSDVGIRTGQTAEQLGVPLLLHMAGSSSIISKDSRHVFRVGSHSSVTDMKLVTQAVEKRGYTKVGAIMADYAWGRSVEAVIEQLMPDGVDLTQAIAPVGASDFTPFLRDMPDDTEMIIATGHPPGQISIHNQANELGLNPELTTGAGFPPGVLAKGLGDNAKTFAHQHVADPYSDQFVEVANRYREARGERFDTHHAYGYIAGQVIAGAISAAGSAEPGAIADALRSTTFDTLLRNPIDYVEWGEVDNLIHMLSTFEFEAPEYYPDGNWRLDLAFESEPLPAFDPSNWEFNN